MADAGSLAVYRPVSARSPLNVWAAGEKNLSADHRRYTLIWKLPVWNAGDTRPVSLQAPHGSEKIPLPYWASGNRSTQTVPANVCVLQRTAWYAGGSISLVAPRSGRIAGQVLIEGVPQPEGLVLLFSRPTLRLVASTRTAADGGYAFSELYPALRYLVLAIPHLSQSATVNALVADDIQPVS